MPRLSAQTERRAKFQLRFEAYVRRQYDKRPPTFSQLAYLCVVQTSLGNILTTDTRPTRLAIAHRTSGYNINYANHFLQARKWKYAVDHLET
jgi:hypothetical protein